MRVRSCISSVFICFIELFNFYSFSFPFHRSLFLLLCMFNLCCAMSFSQFRYLLKSLFTFPPPFTLASITQCKHSISILISHPKGKERERETTSISKRSNIAKNVMPCALTRTNARTLTAYHLFYATVEIQPIYLNQYGHSLTLHVLCIPLPATESK